MVHDLLFHELLFWVGYKLQLIKNQDINVFPAYEQTYGIYKNKNNETIFLTSLSSKYNLVVTSSEV